MSRVETPSISAARARGTSSGQKAMRRSAAKEEAAAAHRTSRKTTDLFVIEGTTYLPAMDKRSTSKISVELPGIVPCGLMP